MPTYLAFPKRIEKGQFFWLELEEFPDRPKVAVRVCSLSTEGLIAIVEILASDHTLVSVEADRLMEERG